MSPTDQVNKSQSHSSKLKQASSVHYVHGVHTVQCVHNVHVFIVILRYEHSRQLPLRFIASSNTAVQFELLAKAGESVTVSLFQLGAVLASPVAANSQKYCANRCV